MPYTTPTVDDFKAQFARDFPYAIPAFGAQALAVLAAGAIASFTVPAGGSGYAVAPTVILTNAPGDTGVGATAVAVVANGAVTAVNVVAPGSGYGQAPLVSFEGGAGDETNLKRVTDGGIAGAIVDAQFNVNGALFPNQSMWSRAFLYLAAHELCDKLLMAAAGVQGQYSWLTAGKSVSGVSQTFAIPSIVKDNPFLASVARTKYGAKYIEIIAPLLVGNVQADCTYTNP